MRKLFSLLIIFIIWSIFTLSLNGCGDKNEVSGEKKNDSKQESVNNSKSESADNKEDAQMKKDESNTEQSADLSKNDPNKTNELGMTPGLPANFPSDVPQPKNSKTLGSLNSSEGTVVTFESSEKVQEIVNYYKEEMKKNGYVISESGETLVSDKGGLIGWKKESKEVGLMLGYDKDKNITSLVITYK